MLSLPCYDFSKCGFAQSKESRDLGAHSKEGRQCRSVLHSRPAPPPSRGDRCNMAQGQDRGSIQLDIEKSIEYSIDFSIEFCSTVGNPVKLNRNLNRVFNIQLN